MQLSKVVFLICQKQCYLWLTAQAVEQKFPHSVPVMPSKLEHIV